MVYLSIVITGIAANWHRGFGTPHLPGWADISTNLLLVWMILLVVPFDLESSGKKWIGS